MKDNTLDILEEHQNNVLLLLNIFNRDTRRLTYMKKQIEKRRKTYTYTSVNRKPTPWSLQQDKVTDLNPASKKIVRKCLGCDKTFKPKNRFFFQCVKCRIREE